LKNSYFILSSPFQERTLPPVKLPNRPKVEEINKLLDIIRDRQTIIEQPLGKVLNNNKDKLNQRRAKSLVTQIQRHYEQVRSVSLRSVRTPGTILDTAIDRLQRFDTNASLHQQTMPSRLPTA
jgi:predicted glycosyltransferase